MNIHHRMETAIRSIVKKVPEGKIFDSHFVIDQLIKNHSDVYLIFASSIDASRNKTSLVNGRIAQEIKKLSDVVEQVDNTGDFWSVNMRGKPGECSGWKKRSKSK